MKSLISHTLFLKWWLFITAMLTALAYIFVDGTLNTVWENDSTKLSFALLALTVIMSGWCGYKTWTLSNFIDEGGTEKHLVEKIDRLIEVGWFTSDLCLTVGMMGTVIGFIMMLSGFKDVDVSEVKTVQTLVKNLGAGMSTALYTTLSGLVCGSVLKIQYFNLNQAVNKVYSNEA